MSGGVMPGVPACAMPDCEHADHEENLRVDYLRAADPGPPVHEAWSVTCLLCGAKAVAQASGTRLAA